ncbi:uncharacterized protein LOC118483962 [Helianthus annuus]|uniref:uncharacterized protein LOC118483962 n=1 Tax=Helianthus annuus TaxID=4232 RepID=UPI0016531970|nr:uncharacterized protein LOC118483962 [Helianthus annuus]
MDHYPAIFKLVKNKNASVAEFWSGADNGSSWIWDWSILPSTSEEWSQLLSLFNRLQETSLTNDKDAWFWANDRGDSFSVKDLRSEIVSAGIVIDNGVGNFIWNPWATPKANYLLWRALLGKVASKMGLVSRGVGLPDTLCPRCGISDEDPNHIFANCIWSRSLWWNVFVWLRLKPPPEFARLDNILEDLQNNPGCKKWKRIVYTVASATTWRIWLARNSKVFENTFIPVKKIMDQIKEDAYLWICNRANVRELSWEKWVSFDVADML